MSKGERLTKVLADSTNKKTIVIIVIFLYIFFLSLYKLEKISPPYYINYNPKKIDCPKNLQNYNKFCKNFSLEKTNTYVSTISDLKKINEEFWITSKFKKNSEIVHLKKKIKIKIKIIPLDKNNKKIDNEKIEEIEKNIFLVCEGENDNCEENNILVHDINFERYKIEVNFKINENLKKSIKNINFEIFIGNEKKIKQMEILRYFFLFFSIFFGIYYFLFFFKIEKNTITYEHKFIFWLSIGLILGNNPFYYFCIRNKKLETFLFFFFQTFFYLLLILFLLTMVDRILKNSKNNNILKYNKKIILLGIFFILSLFIFLTFFIINDNPKNPILLFLLYHPFLLLYIFLSIIFLQFFLFFFILYKTYKIFQIWNKILQRHKFFIIISIIFYTFYIKAMVFQFTFAPLFFLNFYITILQISWRFIQTENGYETYLVNDIQFEEDDGKIIEEEGEEESDQELELSTRENSVNNV